MKPLLYLIVFLIISGCKHQNNEITDEKVVIIPKPNKILLQNGSFVSNTIIFSIIEKWEAAGLVIQQILPHATASNDEKFCNLHIIENASFGSESYKLSIDKKLIRLEAATLQGVIHGVQTLSQLLMNKSKIEIACMTIEDEPRFSYRGIHLDVSRHFFDVDYIKKFIDLLSKYKINNFHWHLTDDQGWRIEIKKYPLLTVKSAFRKETLIGHYDSTPQSFDGKTYGGFYTQQEIKEVVRYATARQINIIPEIEMPGHARAAVSAYPELGCTGEKIDVATKWGVFEDVFCPNEKTFTFLENVLAEVIELFPSRYIHIGGDECPKKQWKESQLCQDMIKKKKLKDEHGLQSYFIKRIEKFINSKGRQIIGWDEILEGGLAPNATVMSWRGEEGGILAAQLNHKVIMTPTDYCYFDYYQSKGSDEPLAIGGYLPLEKVYKYEPLPKGLPKEKHKYILGTQGNLWTEYIGNPSKLEYMLLPRMQAIAEVGWTQPSQKSYDNFLKRLKHHFIFWDNYKVNYANKLGDLLHEINSGDGNGVFLSLKNNEAKLPVKYAVGKTLSGKLNIYTHPIPITESCTILAATMKGDKPSGDIDTFIFQIHKGAGKKIDLLTRASKRYPAKGKGSLNNGVIGNPNNLEMEWLGFEGENLETLIDLGKTETLEKIKLRFLNNQDQWIYPPKNVTIWLSQDGDKYNELPAFVIRSGLEKIIEYNLPIAHTKAKFIKVRAENYGTIPKGKPGENSKSWLFVDEIYIN